MWVTRTRPAESRPPQRAWLQLQAMDEGRAERTREPGVALASIRQRDEKLDSDGISRTNEKQTDERDVQEAEAKATETGDGLDGPRSRLAPEFVSCDLVDRRRPPQSSRTSREDGGWREKTNLLVLDMKDLRRLGDTQVHRR